MRESDEPKFCTGRLIDAAFLELDPHFPLTVPVDYGGNRPQISLIDSITAVGCVGKAKDVLLDIRSEIEEIHELGYPGPGYIAEAGKICIVLNLASSNQILEANR